MIVAITGAGGFIGKNLCRYLAEGGYDVIAVVRDCAHYDGVTGENVLIREGDVTSSTSLKSALHGCDVVINLAALFNHPEKSWEDYYNVNVKGVENVLNVALDAGVKRVVHCSTVGVAIGSKFPLTEDAPYAPPSWDKYETSKCEGEKKAIKFHRDTGYPVAIIRPAQVYGPGDKSKAKFYKMVQRGLIINPGKTLKHLIYIDDLCSAFVLSMQADNNLGQPLIAAEANPIALSNLIEIVAGALGVPVPWKKIPTLPVTMAATVTEKLFETFGRKPPIFRRSMDFFTKSVYFDPTKIRSILGFESKIDVRTGVYRTAEWYRTNGYL